MHGSPWRCIRLSLLLDKPCNICFLPWVGKMINIDLFRRKSFGCLTRVVHKSSWAKLKPRHATPQKEINIGKNTTSSSEMKYIFYSPNTTHEHIYYYIVYNHDNIFSLVIRKFGCLECFFFNRNYLSTNPVKLQCL